MEKCFIFLRKCSEQFTKNCRKFKSILRKLYEVFGKSFMNRIFLLFHFVLCCTQQNAMLGKCTYQKIWWGPGPTRPSDATPMPVISFLLKMFFFVKQYAWTISKVMRFVKIFIFSNTSS